MLKRIIATFILFIGFIAIGLIICTSNKFNYALDYELNVLKPECTYLKYVQNKQECIKVIYQ